MRVFLIAGVKLALHSDIGVRLVDHSCNRSRVQECERRITTGGIDTERFDFMIIVMGTPITVPVVLYICGSSCDPPPTTANLHKLKCMNIQKQTRRLVFLLHIHIYAHPFSRIDSIDVKKLHYFVAKCAISAILCPIE